jgi:hypothetical protein
VSEPVKGTFAVMSPWADIDPIPPKGLQPRLSSLADKKIGLFINSKRAATPMLNLVEKRLKAQYPEIEFSYFSSVIINEPTYETKEKDKFEDWLKGVDAVVAAVGD